MMQKKEEKVRVQNEKGVLRILDYTGPEVEGV